MSLNQALLTSSSGLRTVQAGLALVSSNVANAETPGYVRKTLAQIATVGAGVGASVRVGAINRVLDQYVQRQLRIETSGGSYADLRATFHDRIQLLFGEPGADGTLENAFNGFTAALQNLTTTPESYPARGNALDSARVLAQHLNTMTVGIQGLRADAERGLADAVGRANEAMRQIADINVRLAASPGSDTAAAVLMDQRDRYIDELAGIMDIRVLETDNDQVTVFTNSGIQLVGASAAQLEFDAQGTITPSAQWSTDPAKRSVGTVTLVQPGGGGIDLLANGTIRSGAIAAYAEMRDRVLVEAQAQLDAIATAMAQALSDRTIAGAPASAGPQNGFDIDLTGLLAGNSIEMTFTDIGTGDLKAVTLVRVDDPGALPLDDAATVNPDDTVFGINFSGGMASITSQIATALGTDFTVSNPGGTTLRILDDGGVDTAMADLSARQTTTALANGSVELPFFLDGAAPYTGAITANGSQGVGFAGRVAVNAALIADPAKIVAYSTSPPTLAGDTTRPDFLLTRLSQTSMRFSPQGGIGSTSMPFEASLSGYLREVISHQGAAAAAASSLQEGQSVVVAALEERAADVSGVNIDDEMAHLLQLQTAYSANARVMSVVKEMLEILSRI